MHFTKTGLAAAAAVALLSVPAQAQSRAAIDGFLGNIDNDVEDFTECAIDNYLSRDCGNAAGAVVCDYQGIMQVGVESNKEAYVADTVRNLQRLISRNADYLESLIAGGHMPDTGKISGRETTRYCRSVNAAVIPYF